MVKRVAVLFTLAVLAFAVPGRAHHAFSSEFDSKAPVKLQGPITKVELINPHAWIHIEVKKPDGKTEEWMVEGGTPNTLQRRGITRDSLKVGTIIVVEGYRSKDGSNRANGRNLTFQDGRTLFMCSAPDFHAEAREAATEARMLAVRIDVPA